MLEKMGWQHGKGLGAKEDGMVENVKVSYKNDSKGMGYKESNDQWTEHESKFTALLESLTGETQKADEVTLNSLEKKSQASRARVHYHKFTRGKDLSRYSEKDLANIFGKKSLKQSKIDSEQVEEDQPNENKNNTESQFIINGGSMRDYFKKKLPGFEKSSAYVIGSNGVLTKVESDSESEMQPSFGIACKSEVSEDTYKGFGYTRDASSNNNEPSSGSFQSSLISYLSEDSISKRKSEECDVEGVASPKKKPKKRQPDNLGVPNPAFNPIYTPVNVQKHVLDPIEECQPEENSYIDEKIEVEVSVYEQRHSNKDTENELCIEQELILKNKKRTGNHFDDIHIEAARDTPISNDCLNIETQNFQFDLNNKKHQGLVESNMPAIMTDLLNEIKSKKVKRKKNKVRPQIEDDLRHETGVFQNQNFNESSKSFVPISQQEENPYEVKVKPQMVEEKKKRTKVKAKKMNKESSKMEFENPSFQSSTEVEDSTQLQDSQDNPYEVNIKQKKKKKKVKSTMEFVNPNFESIEVKESINWQDINDNPYEVKIKKHKKKKTSKMDFENPIFQISTDLEKSTDLQNIVDNPYEIKIKPKKKNKKNYSMEFENPNFETIEAEETTNPQDIEHNPYEVKIKTPKKKKTSQMEFENPNFQIIEAEDLVKQRDIEDNPYEVKVKKKNKMASRTNLDFPNFNNGEAEDSNVPSAIQGNSYEVNGRKKAKESLSEPEESDYKQIGDSIKAKRKKKQEEMLSSVISNNILEVKRNNKSDDINAITSLVSNINNEECLANTEESDLMFNIVCTPVLAKTKREEVGSVTRTSSVNRRKSVRFCDVTQELIIPNNEELRRLEESNEETNKLKKKVMSGVDNKCFDKLKSNLEENLDTISKTIEMYQAEIENDINEKKQIKEVTMEDLMVGEIGNPTGENEKVADGTKLKFKYAHFDAKTPFYQLDKTGAKKSYKHLIKGDILVKFKNTNLHKINGYAVRNKVDI